MWMADDLIPHTREYSLAVAAMLFWRGVVVDGETIEEDNGGYRVRTRGLIKQK